MNREDIIRMAREACDPDTVDAWKNGYWTITQEELERFAAIVAAAEREACVRECENHRIEDFENDGEPLISAVALECAEAIRKRGEI
jgi:hypothetical protein